MEIGNENSTGMFFRFYDRNDLCETFDIPY